MSSFPVPKFKAGGIDGYRFMMDLMSFPDQVRNIALVGHLHHGKTAFMDMLVLETHDLGANTEGKKGEQVLSPTI